jgi:hypothetical protein
MRREGRMFATMQHRILVALFLAASPACALAQESAVPTFEGMENAKRAAEARQRETVVSLMSLETISRTNACVGWQAPRVGAI